MTSVIYSIVVFVSTTLGAMVGLGGGVIIKPVLDLIGHDNVEVIGFISAIAVFSMSISSTIKHIKSKTKFDKKNVLFIALGASIGGYIGNEIFDFILNFFDNHQTKGIQGLMLGIILIAINIYINGNFNSFKIKNNLAVLLVGLFLGMTASFLGVGGGPINVAVMVFFFSYSVKEAAVYSVATIFFSQLSKLITIYASNQFTPFDLSILIYIVPCAIIGGILGTMLNQKCNEKNIKKIFTIAVYAIALVNFYNAFTGLIVK